jgi:hypothetical protein
MKENQLLGLLIFVGFFLIIGFGIYYYYKILPSITGGKSPLGTPPKSPLNITLSVSPFTTGPEKIAELTATINSELPIDAPNTTAFIILPEGITLVSGNTSWKGDIPAKSSVKFSVKIKAEKKGEWVVEAFATPAFEYFTQPKVRDVLYFIVCEDVKVSRTPPENNWYEKTQVIGIPSPENNEMINSTISFSALPELNKEVTLTYTVTPSIDLPDPQRTRVMLIYPPRGFKIVNVEFPAGGEVYKEEGQLTWKGSILKGETIQIKAVVKAITTGDGYVYGYLIVSPDGKTITNQISDVNVLKVKVGECYAKVEIPGEIEARRV